MQNLHPGGSVQCTVLVAIARWGEGYRNCWGPLELLHSVHSGTVA